MGPELSKLAALVKLPAFTVARKLHSNGHSNFSVGPTLGRTAQWQSSGAIMQLNERNNNNKGNEEPDSETWNLSCVVDKGHQCSCRFARPSGSSVVVIF